MERLSHDWSAGARPAGEENAPSVCPGRLAALRPLIPPFDLFLELDLGRPITLVLVLHQRATITSPARGVPSCTMKFACTSDTRAPPIRKPLNPSPSMILPADSPGGFLKIQPALLTPTGWVFFRSLNCLSMSPRMAAGSSSSSRRRHPQQPRRRRRKTNGSEIHLVAGQLQLPFAGSNDRNLSTNSPMENP